ncbi:hypothetical protein BH10PLA2_BH10PLA2_33880 [soil metagenome]
MQKNYSGPVRISGSAGTGKTIVALHRAAYLAKQNPNSRVLLTTFSDPLASALQTKLRRLLGNEPRLAERIDVHSLEALGVRLHATHVGKVALASQQTIADLLQEASRTIGGHKFSKYDFATAWSREKEFLGERSQTEFGNEWKVLMRLE